MTRAEAIKVLEQVRLWTDYPKEAFTMAINALSVKESIDFEQAVYDAFGQVKDFTLAVRIARYFYEKAEKDYAKLKELADNMYSAAQYLTTDASQLHKAMEEYHKFVCYELNK